MLEIVHKEKLYTISTKKLKNKWKWEINSKDQPKKWGYLPLEWTLESVINVARHVCTDEVSYLNTTWLTQHVDYLLKNIGMESLLKALIANLQQYKPEEGEAGEYLPLLIWNLQKTQEDYSHRNDYLDKVEIPDPDTLPALTPEDLAALDSIPKDFIERLFEEEERRSDDE